MDGRPAGTVDLRDDPAESRSCLSHREGLAGKRIGLLSHILSRDNGGVFEAVVGHANMLRGLGAVPVMVGLQDRFTATDLDRLGDHEVHALYPLAPPALGYAPHALERLHRAKLDLLHLHGLWTGLSSAAARWRRRTGGAYCISPHGMLDPWILNRNRLRKAIATTLFERRSWNAADAFHALTDVEAAQIAKVVGTRPIHAIPNAAPAIAERARFGAPVVLYIGRLHPKKNLENLIEAWRSVEEHPSLAEAELRIAGTGKPGYEALLHRRAAGLRIRFTGAVHGEHKQQLFQGARFCILPSLSEGLPMAMLEAWAHGVPTIMSANCNLGQGFAAGSALLTGTQPGEIRQSMETGLKMSHERWDRMSYAALALAAETFSYDTIAAQWLEAYAAMLSPSNAGA